MGEIYAFASNDCEVAVAAHRSNSKHPQTRYVLVWLFKSTESEDWKRQE